MILLLLLPVTALAATVENITYLDENGTQQTAASATQVTNSDTQWTDGWYVAQSNITIDGTVTISGNVHLILEDGCNLTVNGGILLQSDGNMYIYAQSTEKERMGSLTATGTDAGFKEAGYDGTQALTIAGGKISASGSDVGISAVNLTITDGYVSALGTDLNGTSIAVYDATISGGFVDLYGKFAGTLSTGIDGHAVISSTGEIKNIAADCKGFFLIQKAGKIYGDTFTLTQDLNIANSNIVVTVEEGQTLTFDNGVTLTIPYFATLTNNGTLNNNGTIINTGTMYNSGTLNNNGTLNNTNVLNNAGSIINNGTLTGEVGGSGTVTPKITTDSLDDGTVGESYTATLEATGNNITWSSSGMPEWMTLGSSTGVISGTPTTADTYTFTVTATNESGSDSKVYTLTIQSVPVTDVTLDQTELDLFTGASATLTATVKPSDATDKTVTWSSDNEAVATVDENGKVTAVGEGEATITVTTEDGGKQATCTVAVTQSIHSITADITALDFGNAYTGYTQPAAQTVTITNNGNQDLTLNQPASTNGFEVGNLTKTELPVGETATFTVQPKAGLEAETYSENITVSGSGGASLSITASFNVRDEVKVEPSGSTNLSFTTDRDEFTLTATVRVDGELQNPNGSWTWTVEDENVVERVTLRSKTVSYSTSSQAFTIKGTGTTTITATYDDGTYRGSVYFTVRISKPTPPDPIRYYNIYVEDVCDGVEVSTSKQVVREGGSINVYVKKDTANYTFDNFHVYYKEGYYDSWNELKEGTQPGEYPIKNIWTHIYIKAEGAEEKEDPTGIESIEGVKVYTKDGSLYVQTPQREQVIIVSMSGAVVKSEEQVGLKQYHGLQPGIYIVRVGDRAYKVRLN